MGLFCLSFPIPVKIRRQAEIRSQYFRLSMSQYKLTCGTDATHETHKLHHVELDATDGARNDNDDPFRGRALSFRLRIR